MADEPEKEEGWVEHPAFADRPQKEPLPNTTFAERLAARQKASKKAVQSDDAENKAVSSSRASRKSSK